MSNGNSQIALTELSGDLTSIEDDLIQSLLKIEDIVDSLSKLMPTEKSKPKSLEIDVHPEPGKVKVDISIPSELNISMKSELFRLSID